jgi:hypothetical protein
VLKKPAPYFLLVAVPLAALSPLWLHAHAMAFDMADYFLPNRYFLSECLRNGIFPWWNPYSGLGIPFSADPQSGAFYPIVWFFGIIGYNFYTINLEYLLHLIIAGWGMYRFIHAFTKSVTASVCMALCYQLCGVFIGNAQHLTWIISAAWLPWVLYFWRKIFAEGNWENAIVLALCLMMMTTGGYPAFIIILLYVFIISFAAFLLLSWRIKQSRRAAPVFLLTFMTAILYLIITSPYIVSFVQALPHFTRARAIGNPPDFMLPFTPAAVISFLFPAATLSHIEFFHSDVSMLNAYFGLMPLVFLLALFITKQKAEAWWLFSISCFFILISFGNDFFLWKWIYEYVPLMNRIRFPAAFRLFAISGFLITAGLVMNNVNTYRRISWAALAVLIVILAWSLLSFLDENRTVLPSSLGVETLQSFYAGSTITNNMLAQSFFQVLIILLLLIAFALRSRISQPRFHAMLIIIVACDMIIATRMNVPVTVVSKFHTDSLDIKLKSEPEGFPVSMERTLSEVTHEGNGSYAPSYYNNNLFRKQLAFNSYNPFKLNNRDSLDRFAQKQILFEHPLLYASNHLNSYAAVQLQQGEVLLDDDFNEVNEISGRDSLISEIRIQHFLPGKMSAGVATNQSSVLTLLQNFYPGWKATIDGKPVAIQRSNFSMMSVILTSGKHDVQFDYDPGMIRWLLWLSVAVQLALIVVLILRSKRNADGSGSSVE